jgi:hypothetical protein
MTNIGLVPNNLNTYKSIKKAVGIYLFLTIFPNITKSCHIKEIKVIGRSAIVIAPQNVDTCKKKTYEGF